MPSTSVRRTILFLLFAMVLVGAWPSTAATAQRSSTVSVRAADLDMGFFSRIWSFLQRLESKEGCGIDPFGRCANDLAQNPPIQAKEGCHIDPFGRCLP